jgi:photosystem II stability/assembly factor-like uncharacterized protein
MSLEIGHTFIVPRLLLLGIVGLLLGGSPAAGRGEVLAPLSISFFNTRDGIASFIAWHSCGPSVRCRGAIETTRDGGRSWTIRRVGAVVRSVEAVPGTREAWAALEPVKSCGTRLPSNCPTTLLNSVDGGATWTRTGAYVTAPAFADAQHGFGVRGAKLVATSDGGKTWRLLGGPCRRFDGASVSFVSATRGWLLCAGGGAMGAQPKTLYETRDGGHHWTLVMKTTFTRHTRGALPLFGYPGGLDFVDARTAWIGEARGDLYATGDGGRTWRSLRITSPDVVEAESTSLLAPGIGFVLLRNGAAGRYELRLTRDGGRTFGLVRTWPIE